MKYVFLVHSHITYYLALSVIEYNGYSEDKVVLLFGRGYDNQYGNKYFCINVSKAIYSFNQIGFENVLVFAKKIKKYIKDVDWLLLNNIGDVKYALYLPHFVFPFMQVLATNVNCTSINFIEEGTSSYSSLSLKDERFVRKLKRYMLTISTWIINASGLTSKRYKRVISNFDYRHISGKVGNFFSISNLCFPFIPDSKKIVVELFKENEFKYNLKEKNLIFFEGVVQQGYCLKESYLKVVQHIITDNASLKTFCIKYHPEQTMSDRKEIEDVFLQNDIAFFVIPSEIPVEQLFISYKELNLFGCFTSLLFYGSLTGHKVKSYDHYLQAIDAVYFNYRKIFDFDITKYLSGSVI